MFQQAAPSVIMVSDAAQGLDAGKPVRGLLSSGFAWDKNHVVTSAKMIVSIPNPVLSVVKKEAETGLEEHDTLRALLVGLDPVTDVAVLAVDGVMTPLERGSTSQLQVGQDVYALGHPFGFERSLSKGVVAGLSRTLVSHGRPLGGVIQTDAAVNPGSNGGPLLNSAGKVIGVSNSALTHGGDFVGIGLAVPIETVARSVNSLLATGHVESPSLGVSLAKDSLPQTLGINGVMVRQVEHGGPAEAAGLRPMHGGHLGDVIVAINEKPVSSMLSFYQALDGKNPGDEVLISVKRPSFDESSDEWLPLDFKLALTARIL